MTKEQREKLDAMRDELGDLLDADEGIGDKLPPKNQVFCMRFSEVGQLLRAGKGRLFQPGDEIWNQSPLFAEPLRWIVIGRDVDGENTLTVWCPQGMGELPFDEQREGYPYGHALWRDCSLRAWMNGQLLESFGPEAEYIRPVKKVTIAPDADGGQAIETEDRFWPLSACEIGFAPDRDWSVEEGGAYPLFTYKESRKVCDDWLTLRSCYRGFAHYRWIVVASAGGAYSYYASSAIRPAPACVIG